MRRLIVHHAPEICTHTIGQPKPSQAGSPELFAQEANRIRSMLGSNALRIEHVGSTLRAWARPEADHRYVAGNCGLRVPAREAGYLLRIRESEWYEHRMFKGPETDINLHVFSAHCPEVGRMLMFRDWLRENAAAARFIETHAAKSSTP
ncbi:MAG: GrpB family protein [Bryobacterales bacterium]|nr:GrpB family protein [Bryobacterales bacterium]MBV9401573.1 GrpB family protein [Bryobacterales bacterium]